MSIPWCLEEDGKKPRNILAYMDPAYWSDRFLSEGSFDWLVTPQTLLKSTPSLRDLLASKSAAVTRVLNMATGNSAIPFYFVQEGADRIVT